MLIIDPLGLNRCQICSNAFEYDFDENATVIWRAYGNRGFVCKQCALQYREHLEKAEKELNDD
jgi:hypothetical protein